MEYMVSTYGDEQLSSEAETAGEFSPGHPAAGLGAQSAGPSRGCVFNVATTHPAAAGAETVGRALVAKFAYEAILVPEDVSPSAIGRSADLRDRAAIVLPASDFGHPTRPMYADRACRIALATRHPVVLAPTSAAWPIKRCVAATDFGRPSLAAVRVAMQFLDAPAELVLAFVNASDEPGRNSSDVVPHYVQLLLEALPQTLEPPESVNVAIMVLTGDVLPALLTFARRFSADLLTLGRQGRSTSPGLLGEPIGPTVRGLLEGSPCTALVASAS